ncbi:Transcriptional regulator LytR [Dietzia timorensis]|uniref:Transcriptional regulator LytR n=3 Tax=Dietzia timorensis TaxID=499555 RepID=A0A173LHU0_9ACTN|nr:Transcriptional regulator LytR [Dietzia timorensis]
MRRHLSPEEAAEQRRRARARREAASRQVPEGRPAPAPRQTPDPSGQPRHAAGPAAGQNPPNPNRTYGRFDPGPGRGAAYGAGAAGAAGAAAGSPAGVPRETPRGAPAGSGGSAGPRYQPTQQPERFDDGYHSERPRRASRHAPPQNPVVQRPQRGRRPAPRPAARTAPRRKRRFGFFRILALLLVVILTAGVLTTLWADSKLQHVDALSDYPGKPGGTPGTVTLVVGTDSRAGLTEEEQAQLATGSEQDAGGDRTDTMMLVYKPADGGKPMIISIPRDLLVDIPEYGEYKINAAYSLGGPKMLVQTLETETGIRIDHYAEIGFGGFAGIVDAVGGIEMCLDEPIDDPDAGINLGAGCQTLAGPQALGFVRTRHGFAQQDLDRVQNQRKFLSALMSEVTKPSTLLNPFRVSRLVSDGAATIRVDEKDHIWDLGMMMWSIRSEPVTATVPFDGMADGAVGSYLVWGDTTNAFFDNLRRGATPPADLYEMPPA